ncbi:Phospholipid-transporting ATPase 2 [Phytophthora cinnamomi]|uniref:Phospholipid-transporting ATPase 2 n=1 Tax=Phytophthora cinnamomi TaxID=4785 RepID=UPI00355A807A|nr:Phospholipid-transporting ATPase 2 [Phytophthora cinnamomi]
MEENAQAHIEAPEKKRRVYKKRKATNTVRKEEKAALEAEIRALEIKLDALKFRESNQRGEEDPSLHSRIAHNALMRNLIQKHHLIVANSQAMLVSCVEHHSFDVRPTEMYIHLAADQTVRHETLSALREPKLQYARRFITQRSNGLHPTTEYFKEERFETPEGDYCNVRFDRTALCGVAGGVRAAFAAVKHVIFNAEIILSEASGNITIREDCDFGDNTEDFSHMRLVAQTSRGVAVENNLVHFSELVQADKGQSYALATMDFVDQDDRFPYHPLERIRRDATAIILLTPSQSESVVVMTRWVFTRIHGTKLDVPTRMLRAMRDVSISDTILSSMKETLNLPR